METTANGPCTSTTPTTNNYEVQTGKDKSSYKAPTSFCTLEAAETFYESITCKKGEKKRLMLNGVCLKRTLPK